MTSTLILLPGQRRPGESAFSRELCPVEPEPGGVPGQRGGDPDVPGVKAPDLELWGGLGPGMAEIPVLAVRAVPRAGLGPPEEASIDVDRGKRLVALHVPIVVTFEAKKKHCSS